MTDMDVDHVDEETSDNKMTSSSTTIPKDNMMVLSFPLSGADPYAEEKLALIQKVLLSCTTTTAKGNCSPRTYRHNVGKECVEVKIPVLAASPSEDEASGAPSSTSISTRTLLEIASVVTMNVHDLYFGHARDARRGLFLLHKLLLSQLQENEKLQVLEDQMDLKENELRQRLQEVELWLDRYCNPGNTQMNGSGDEPPRIPEQLRDAHPDMVTTTTTTEQENRIYLHPALRVGSDENSGDGLYTTNISRSFCTTATGRETEVGVASTAQQEKSAITSGDVAIRVPSKHLLNAATAAQDRTFRPFYERLLREIAQKQPHVHAVEERRSSAAGKCAAFLDAAEEQIAMAYLIFLRRFLRGQGEGEGQASPATCSTTMSSSSGRSSPEHGGSPCQSAGPSSKTFSTGVKQEEQEEHALDQQLLHGRMRFLLSECLPQTLDDCPATLLTWPEEALENLYCPQVIYQVETARLEMNEFFEMLKRVFSSTEEVEQPGLKVDVDLDDVLWAKCIFDSRAFQLDSVLVGPTATAADLHEDKEPNIQCAWKLLAELLHLGEEDENESGCSGSEDEEDVREDGQLLHKVDEGDLTEGHHGLDVEIAADNMEDAERVLAKKLALEASEEVEVVGDVEDSSDGDSTSCCAEQDTHTLDVEKKPLFQVIDQVLPVATRLTCLAPVADYLNHDRRSPLMVPRFDQTGKSFVLQAAASVPPSRQLCLNYGPLQNWELLLYYGFCFEENPADTLQLELGEPEDAETRLMLRLHKVTTDHVLAFVEAPEGDPVPENNYNVKMFGELDKITENEMDQGQDTTHDSSCCNLHQASTSTASSSSSATSSATTGGGPRWPLSSKLLTCLRILHGIEDLPEPQQENSNSCSTSNDELRCSLVFDPSMPCCAADVQICDTLLDVFSQLLIPSDETLKSEVMQPESNGMWEQHPVFGPLARRFRESQRKLVNSNIRALQKFREKAIEAQLQSMRNEQNPQSGTNKSKRRRKR
ncbi:unnamed protein product [Amoebophrya sp. A25]|nr:unnamed protein product [Amoebophrya sp. A25]|eukprot:GSA25T00018579001.1